MAFIRSLSNSAIDNLKETDLFKKHLEKDCRTGIVFPAIRQERVDFYYKGGKLFSWCAKNGFSTHKKYASVLVLSATSKTEEQIEDTAKDYITEKMLTNNARLITNYSEGYSRIKENCALYSGVEASGVAELYHGFSCASEEKRDIVVLDIEIAFPKSEESSRIDFVTLDCNKKELRFFEAKHFSNKASLRSSKNSPALCEQLERYDACLQSIGAEIIEAYAKHTQVLNHIFGTNLPQPTKIDSETKGIIFGFDIHQKAYLDEKILSDSSSLKKRTYTIGEIKKADLAAVFRGGKQNWE